MGKSPTPPARPPQPCRPRAAPDRVTVNPYNYILEADKGHDTNDVAYTYFQVTGNDIHVLERGHGTSPWDPHKTVESPVFGEVR